MQGKIKLYYFDIYGRAEPIRMLFYHAKVDFEDIRFEYPRFKELKETLGEEVFEFGQVPVIETPDGQHFAQSLSILRLLGKWYGSPRYYPEDPVKAWRVDSTLDANADLQEKYWDVQMAGYKGETEDKQKKLLEDFLNKTLPAYLKVMQKRLIANGGSHQ